MGRRDNVNIIYNTSLPVIFGVKHYAEALMKLIKRRNITLNVQRNLVEVRHKDNIAVFEDLAKPGVHYEETVSAGQLIGYSRYYIDLDLDPRTISFYLKREI